MVATTRKKKTGDRYSQLFVCQRKCGNKQIAQRLVQGLEQPSQPDCPASLCKAVFCVRGTSEFRWAPTRDSQGHNVLHVLHSAACWCGAAFLLLLQKSKTKYWNKKFFLEKKSLWCYVQGLFLLFRIIWEWSDLQNWTVSWKWLCGTNWELLQTVTFTLIGLYYYLLCYYLISF